MPQILDPPGNLTVVELETATFSCLATGRPRPAIVWVQLSDMTLVQSSDFTIEGMEIGHRERRSNLTILSTQPSDAGAYSCVAVNEPGIDMDQATLTVHGEIVVLLHRVCALELVMIFSLFHLCSGTKDLVPTSQLNLCCE